MNDTIAADGIHIDPSELRDTARRLLKDLVDRRASYRRQAADGGADLFARMVEQGWTLLTLSSNSGGLGQSFASLAPMYEEMGRAISPVFLAPTLAALEALAFAAHADAAARLGKAIGSGDARIAAALVESAAVECAGGAESLRLHGRIASVIFDPGTTHLLLIRDGDPRLLLLELVGKGVSSDPVEMWDRSRRAVDVVLEDCSAVILADSPQAAESVRAHLDLALAWDSLGGARQALEETIAYMCVRQQFGRPIGSFQALKHRAADHKVGLETASALTRGATAAFAECRSSSGLLVGQARLLANQVYRAISEDGVQLHGGIGFTWEHDCHLFLKRAWLNDMLFGSANQRRDLLARKLLPQIVADRIG